MNKTCISNTPALRNMSFWGFEVTACDTHTKSDTDPKPTQADQPIEPTKIPNESVLAHEEIT
jgi:hypothetical protein